MSASERVGSGSGERGSGSDDAPPKWMLASELEALPAFGPAERLRITRAGEYELLGELGRGGMGVVYRARHVGTGRVVALKMLSAGWRAEEQRKRFFREARAASRLSHRNLVPIRDVGEERGCPFLVMDLVEGGSLQERLSHQGPLPPRDAARIVARVADALHCTHQAQILHRDIKPANILLDPEGEPLLTDFGLAKVLDDELQSTGGTQVMGTPQFLSPEQAAGAPVDARADVWALGVTLYWALTGTPPFAAATVPELLQLIGSGSVEAPSRRAPGIEPDLDAVVLTCLEKLPERRYPTAQALSRDLDRLLAGRPVSVRPRHHEQGPGKASPRERLRRWARSHPLPTLLVGVALALVASAGIVEARRGARPTSPGGAAAPPPADCSPETRVELARHLAGCTGPLQTAARLLLVGVEAGTEPLPERAAAGVACCWARLAGPGELGRALRRARALRDRAVLGTLDDPAGAALQAIAGWEGWGGPPDPERVRAMAAALCGPGSGVVRRWLEHAALVGDRQAARLLLWPPADPTRLDPRDLLGFDGSRAVCRPEADERAAAQALERLRAAGEPGTLAPLQAAELRRLAAQGARAAQLAMGSCFEDGLGVPSDPRAALAWYALAALDGVEETGSGLAAARVAVGRCLLLGCDATEPGEAERWLGSGLERARKGGPGALETEAELWLGVSHLDRDAPQRAAALSRVHLSLEAARSTGTGERLMQRLAAAAPSHAGIARLLPLLGADPAAVGRLGREAARGDAEAQRWLEALAAARPGPWRVPAGLALALVRAVEGQEGAVRAALQQAGHGDPASRHALAELDAGRLTPEAARGALERLARGEAPWGSAPGPGRAQR